MISVLEMRNPEYGIGVAHDALEYITNQRLRALGIDAATAPNVIVHGVDQGLRPLADDIGFGNLLGEVDLFEGLGIFDARIRILWMSGTLGSGLYLAGWMRVTGQGTDDGDVPSLIGVYVHVLAKALQNSNLTICSDQQAFK
jgi:hypothetical protein